MYRFITRIIGALAAALFCSFSVAEDLPIIDQSAQDQYWIEVKPLRFDFHNGGKAGRHLYMRHGSSGYCFNASFIIDNLGAVNSVEILKTVPEQHETVTESIKKQILRSKYHFKPAPQNSSKQPISTNVVFYKKGDKPDNEGYIGDISTACDVSLKDALAAQNVNASVDMDDLKAKGKLAVQNHYSTYSCEKKGINCACAREAFLKKWDELGVAASARNMDFDAIEAACRIQVSDDTVLALLKADAAKMRSKTCEKNPAWKIYDCACMEEIYIEEGLKGAGSPMTSMAQRAMECKKTAQALTQSEIDKEARQVLQKCETNAQLSQHVQCSCLAENFAKARKEKGRDAGQDTIISRLSNQCINVVKKVENAKSSCLKGKIFFDMKGVKLGDYCDCVSTEFETLLSAHTGRFDPRSEGRLESQAKAQCKKSLIPR